jgi:sporulation protein YlmC with PRC-barrel domain
MDQTTYASRLRYLDAKDVDNSVVNFSGLNVLGTDGAKLGDVDGFVVDSASGRVLYTVVDSGGWFRSHRFLIPIGHATVDREGGALNVDVTRDRLTGYPEFDEKRFTSFSDEDFRAYDSAMAAECCPDDGALDVTTGPDERRHYKQPDWWTRNAYLPERLRPVEPRPIRG